MAQLIEYNKKFIIGNTNALTYKDIFSLFKENKICTGYTNFNVGMYFFVPDIYKEYHEIRNSRKLVRVSISCWFTNLPVKKHTENIILYKHYTPEEYPTYANFDAINVNKSLKIPCDYNGIMGVPITFLDKYNPDQFEIIGLRITDMGKSIGVGDYDRKYKTPASRDGTLYYVKDGKGVVPYARVLIRKKASE